MINRVFPPSKGATGRLLLELASALSGEGYDITVLTTGEKSDIKREKYGIEIIHVKAPRYPRTIFANLIVSLKLFFKALFLPKPDLIITKTDPILFVFFGALLALFKRTKHIHWCQDLYPDILPALNYKVSSITYKIMDWFSTRALKSCTRIIAISSCMKYVLEKKGIDPNHITIIPNWNNYVVNRNTDEPEQGELPMKFRVLYSGHMGLAHPYKTMLGAAEILGKDDSDIEFLFVGNSFNMQRMARERARRGLDNVRFLPYQPRRKLRTLYESGDVHLISMADNAVGCMMPSRIYDIFTVQRPSIFIGPETSEVSIMLEKHEAGLTIAQDRADHLADAIRYLRDNGEEWYKLYEGAGRAAKIYHPTRCLELWKNLLEKI